MHDEKDYRQKRHFQVYRSETKTIALCRDIQFASFDTPGFASFVNARIRIRKEDRRLPIQFMVGFEADGGSPDFAQIAVQEYPSISVRELVLLNRSYVPVVNRIGNSNFGGANKFATQRGSLGIALNLEADCDAIDIALHLTTALGDIDPLTVGTDSRPTRFGGRWICGYCITVNDRMSIEEWENAVQKCNMMVECFSDSTGGLPILANTVQPYYVDTTVGDDVEGTGGTNIPNDIVTTGTGEMG